MIKHLLLIIWATMFLSIAITIALISVLFGRPEFYDIVISIEVLIFFLLIPLIFIDLKLSSRYKIKKKISEKDLELQRKEAEIEALKKQRAEISEDDIIISKETHTCLVHKGPVKGYSFVCPECGAVYCIKCVDAIIRIENSCWSCESPIDRSQPVKGADGGVRIEQDIHKAKRRFCIYCGKQIGLETIICPFCGKKSK